MKIELPVFVDASSLSEVDAFYQRDGVFVPLRRAADPDAARARRSGGDAERLAEAHRRLGPIVEQIAAIDGRVAPLLDAAARVAAARPGADVPSEREVAELRAAAARARV